MVDRLTKKSNMLRMRYSIFIFLPFLFTAAVLEQDRSKLEKKIDDAIISGVDFLKKAMQGEGKWIGGKPEEGNTALVVYTMIRCKERLPDKLKSANDYIEKGVKLLLDYKGPGTNGGDEQYAIALTIMALEAHNKKKHEKKIKELVNMLVARQCEKTGGWGYGYQIKPINGTTHDDTKVTVRSPDVSISQYVILSLFAANHGGIKVGKHIFQNGLKFLLKAQYPNGGWTCCGPGGGGVGTSGTSTDDTRIPKTQGVNLNMTAAGLGSVLLCEYILEKNLGSVKADEIKASKAKAIELFEKNWKNEKHEAKTLGHGYQHFYYLYGIERAFTILAKEKIGKDDWYYHGAEKMILPLQKSDGSFDHKATMSMTKHINLQTCFALLFLSRATEGLFTQ